MSIRALLLATVTVAALTTPAFAQVSPGELEGKLTDITTTGTGADSVVTAVKIFGTNIPVPSTTTFATPTRDGMTPAQIGVCNNRKFAGMTRNSKTMVGGTGIVVGTSEGAIDPVTGVGSVIKPETIFLEPAENVLLGRINKVPTFDTVTKDVIDPVTGATTKVTSKVYGGGTLEIEGTNVVLLGPKADAHFPPIGTVPFNPCLPGKGAKNDAGFALPNEALALGADAAAEGWYAEDGSNTFYAFLLDTVGANPDQQTAVSITRAQCRNRSATRMEWEVRGGTADPVTKGAGRVNIGRVNTDGSVTMYGVGVNAVADPANEPYGLYTFKADINNQGQCPNTVVVRYNGSGARAGVDVR